jgi:hypothetical protein
MIAIHESDTELRGLFSGLNVVDRADESIVGAPPLNVIFAPLRDSECSHAMWANPCLLFVPARVYVAAIDTFNAIDPESATSAYENKNWFFDRNGVLVNGGDTSVVATQGIKPMLECMHAFHIFNIKKMLGSGSYWSGGQLDPVPFVVKAQERMLMDVDTEFDFELLDAYLSKKNITFDVLKGILSED